MVIYIYMLLGLVFGRTILLRCLFFEPPDFCTDFVAGLFLCIFVGKKVSRKILQENPRQYPPKCAQQKSSTHLCRARGQLLHCINCSGIDFPRREALHWEPYYSTHIALEMGLHLSCTGQGKPQHGKSRKILGKMLEKITNIFCTSQTRSIAFSQRGSCSLWPPQLLECYTISASTR